MPNNIHENGKNDFDHRAVIGTDADISTRKSAGIAVLMAWRKESKTFIPANSRQRTKIRVRAIVDSI